MASKQKVKGSSFEREVAKELTLRYGENFTRTIGSGAYTGGKNTVRKDYLTENQIRHHKGDITPPDSFYRMNMECKSYQDFQFHLLFKGEYALMEQWITQTLDAADEGDINIIVMKFNRIGKYICVQDYEGMDRRCALNYRDNWFYFEYDVFFRDNEESFKKACEL